MAGESEAHEGASVPVLIPLPLGPAYDYRPPAGVALAPGDVVEVPLGNRRVVGVVWDDAADRDRPPPEKLRTALRRLDTPPMRAPMRRLVDWVASYTVVPPGAVLRMALAAPAALEPAKPIVAYRATGADPGAAGVRLTPARERVLAALAGGLALTGAEIARMADVTPGVARGLASAGLIEPTLLDPDAEPAEPLSPDRAGHALSEAQAAAAAALRRSVEARAFSVTLLDGVTGSGKTEVYFEAIAASLAAGRQALVLLPEIALTAQWLDRFVARFGGPPALWHSELSQAERRRAWRHVAHGRAPVVVGARSALFLPFPDLGLVVVDEEHEAAFKQEDGVRYHARDMAVVRARLEGVPCCLVSATPSLETVVNVERGRYGALHLPERHAGAALPKVRVIDLKRDPPPRGAFLAPPLRSALAEALGSGDQAMLFLNRRGYAPLTLCRACGHRFECPSCTAWLVEHRYLGRLECHHCGYTIPTPSSCPACGAEDSLVACGPGVERIAEEVASLFPEARTAVMASDALRGPAAIADLVHRVQAREIDVLIGTQIVAKGHHFPHLTVVGVVDADLGLQGGDLRAGERTFQLLTQVAGRAGRAERAGQAFLQTWQPEHPVIRAIAAGDRDAFLAGEKAAREVAGMPPYGRLAAIVVSAPDARLAEAAAADIARRAPHGPQVRVLGPAPAPLAQLRGRHRFRLLLKADRSVDVPETLRRWLAAVRVTGRVRVQVDVDPYSFM